MRSTYARAVCRFALTLFAWALPSAAGEPHTPFVPWKILKPGDPAPSSPLVLYWLPATRSEMKRSELLTARGLSIFATQCVAMHVIRPDDEERIEALAGDDLLPLVVLVDGDGDEVARVVSKRGGISVAEVENMVGNELASREHAADRMLDRARSKAADGERDEAVALYRTVSAARCMCPRQARDAQRALRKMGVQK